MEHVIQIGINVDDAAIQKAAVNEAAKRVAEELESRLFNKSYSGAVYGLSGYAENLLKDVVEQHKDEIIERAAELVADSLKRSKKYKEVLANLDEKGE